MYEIKNGIDYDKTYDLFERIIVLHDMVRNTNSEYKAEINEIWNIIADRMSEYNYHNATSNDFGKELKNNEAKNKLLIKLGIYTH